MGSKIPRYSVAVALRYSRDEVSAGEPPRVVLTQDDSGAEDMVSLARRFGIPVVEDGVVARALLTVPLEGQVPPSLYEAVSIILDKIEIMAQPSAVPLRGEPRRSGATRSAGTSF